jgi:ferredoxin
MNLRAPEPRGTAPRGTGTPATLLHIDWTRCDGRGLCTEILPELLARDEWGYPLAYGYGSAGAGSNVPVPDTLLAAATDAVSLCPRQALALIDR